MDKKSSSPSIVCLSNAQSAAQRKFYQWVLKWMNGGQTSYIEATNDEPNELNTRSKPDVGIIACLFQALGFKLLSFEKQSQTACEHDDGKKNTPGKLRISIECGTSLMNAVLELNEVGCHCPDLDHVKDASFWSISGTGPVGSIDNIAQRVEETGSNLLPRLSKDVTKVLRDVSHRLFEIIATAPDHNRNTDVDLNRSRAGSFSCNSTSVQEFEKLSTSSSIARSRTQPDLRSNRFTVKSSASRNASPDGSSKRMLQRQRTWDMDIESASLEDEPRPSPPKITSSPTVITELSNSIGQISLDNEVQNTKGLADYILGAQKNLEKALNMLASKQIISSEASLNTDPDTESVKSAPAVIVSPFKVPAEQSNSAKSRSKLSQTRGQSFPIEINGDNNARGSNARRSIEPLMTMSLTRRSIGLDSSRSKTMISSQRRSYGIPMAVSSHGSIASKPLGGSQKALNLAGCNIDLDTGNRAQVPLKNRASPETHHSSGSPVRRTFNSSSARTPSMLKPPTKVSIPKTIPVKVKTPQSSRLSTGIGLKSRYSLSK